MNHQYRDIRLIQFQYFWTDWLRRYILLIWYAAAKKAPNLSTYVVQRESKVRLPSGSSQESRLRLHLAILQLIRMQSPIQAAYYVITTSVINTQAQQTWNVRLVLLW